MGQRGAAESRPLQFSGRNARSPICRSFRQVGRAHSGGQGWLPRNCVFCCSGWAQSPRRGARPTVNRWPPLRHPPRGWNSAHRRRFRWNRGCDKMLRGERLTCRSGRLPSRIAPSRRHTVEPTRRRKLATTWIPSPGIQPYWTPVDRIRDPVASSLLLRLHDLRVAESGGSDLRLSDSCGASNLPPHFWNCRNPSRPSPPGDVVLNGELLPWGVSIGNLSSGMPIILNGSLVPAERSSDDVEWHTILRTTAGLAHRPVGRRAGIASGNLRLPCIDIRMPF